MDSPRAPRRAAVSLPRVSVLPVFAALSFTAVLVLLAIIGRLSVEVMHGKKDPHRYEFGEQGVPPLVGEDTLFDIGVSVFAYKPINETARPECTARADLEWDELYYGTRFRAPANLTDAQKELIQLAKDVDSVQRWPPHSRCSLLYVPETEELWSGVVARNLTLSDKRVHASFEVNIPTEFL